MLRFAEYLELEDFRQCTAASYYRALRVIGEHFGKDPEVLGEEDLRGFFVYLRRDRKWAPKSCRQFLAAAKHFYRGMLGKEFASLDQIKAPDRDDLFWKLVKIDWNADIDRAGNGENAVKYLGQYIRRSVISDHRILAVEGNKVRIRIKNRDTQSYGSTVLDGIEFVRRFLLHVLPDRFHRIRYRGFLHARGKARLQWLQLLLEARLQPPQKSEPIPGRDILCPRCGIPMRRSRRMPRAPPTLRNEYFFDAVAA